MKTVMNKGKRSQKTVVPTHAASRTSINLLHGLVEGLLVQRSVVGGTDLA